MSFKSIPCNYCGKPAPLLTGKTLHPKRRDLWERRFYVCRPCGAWVTCHKWTDAPMGLLANAELRAWRMKAHQAFDPIWGQNPQGGPKDKDSYPRTMAYRWLSAKLGVRPDDCHIGLFDVDMCRRVIEVCEEFSVWKRVQATAREACREASMARIRRLNIGRRRRA